MMLADDDNCETRCYTFSKVSNAAVEAVEREVAVEAPVALEVNGIGLAVMLATPSCLEDFAIGFAYAEGLLETPGDVLSLNIAQVAAGWIVRLQLGGEAGVRALARARTRVSESSCGLCGIESVEALARPLPPLIDTFTPTRKAVKRALEGLSRAQKLGQRTGASHAAAICERDGIIVVLSEDVGRHNALDKAIGALLRQGQPTGNRFALVTSRLSFELVEKCVLAKLGALVAISAPTSLALERAASARLPLIVLAREDSLLCGPSARSQPHLDGASTSVSSTTSDGG